MALKDLFDLSDPKQATSSARRQYTQEAWDAWGENEIKIEDFETISQLRLYLLGCGYKEYHDWLQWGQYFRFADNILMCQIILGEANGILAKDRKHG
jgi:hypothetical protein